jgi:hypothetical protein
MAAATVSEGLPKIAKCCNTRVLPWQIPGNLATVILMPCARVLSRIELGPRLHDNPAAAMHRKSAENRQPCPGLLRRQQGNVTEHGPYLNTGYIGVRIRRALRARVLLMASRNNGIGQFRT